ncbi:hypothetical protein H6794_01750 [Candidatus Nomurabacteria bacterium]|jgi:hypothetical protein|nr:hypothetical protein [Candidatus Nomurabacteria bacterium]
MKKRIGKRISSNLRTLKEDLRVLQKQVTKQSVYARPYAYEKRYTKHRNNLINDYIGGNI